MPERWPTTAAIVAYVERELERVVRSRAGWTAYLLAHAEWLADPDELFAGTPPAKDGPSWSLRRVGESGSYTLQARPELQEFLLWYGHRRVGIIASHWIMRPAVHVSFRHLGPSALAEHFELGDVLRDILAQHEHAAGRGVERYPMNDLSLT